MGVTVDVAVIVRSGRPGSSAGRPGTASRPSPMKPGAGGKRCSNFDGYVTSSILQHLTLTFGRQGH